MRATYAIIRATAQINPTLTTMLHVMEERQAMIPDSEIQIAFPSSGNRPPDREIWFRGPGQENKV